MRKFLSKSSLSQLSVRHIQFWADKIIISDMGKKLSSFVFLINCALLVKSGILGSVTQFSVSRVSNVISIEERTNNPELEAKRRKQFVNFLSGGIAGTISSTLTAPLEVLSVS